MQQECRQLLAEPTKIHKGQTLWKTDKGKSNYKINVSNTRMA